MSSLNGSAVVLPSSVDLRLVWGLVGGFVVLSLVISSFSRVKWIRHRRTAELLATAAVEGGAEEENPLSPSPAASSSSSNCSSPLTAFASALLSQREATSQLFSRQEEAIRSHFDRLVAEAEQMKALLAVRMSEDRGYVDAAIALLLAEMTAAKSYRTRQKKREGEVEAIQSEVLHLSLQLNSRDPAGPFSPTAVTLLKDRCASYCAILSTVLKEGERERQRVHHVASSSSILGHEALSLLNAHVDEEAEAERRLHRALRSAHNNCERFRFDCLELEVEMEGPSSITAGTMGRWTSVTATTTTTSLSRRLLQSTRRLHVELSRGLEQWMDLTSAVEAGRKLRAVDESLALEALERQKALVDEEQSKGIFAGLDPSLTQSLTFFIQQAGRQVKERSAKRDYPSSWSVPAVPAASPSSSLPSSRAPVASCPSFLSAVLSFDSTATPAVEMTVAIARARDADMRLSPAFAASKGPSEMLGEEAVPRTSLELSTMYSDWLSQSRVKAQLSLAELSRQLNVGGQLDLQSCSSLTPLTAEEEQRLRKAQSDLISTFSSHERQVAALVDSGWVEERKQAEVVLKDLHIKETAVAAKEAELRAESHNTTRHSGSTAINEEKEDGDLSGVSADLIAALQALREELYEERRRAEMELQSIHTRVDAKMRRTKAALKKEQGKEEAKVLARYEEVIGEIEVRIGNASSVQVEGMDLWAVKEEVERGSTASGRETALLQFHASALQELQRTHAQALRLLLESQDSLHKAEVEERRGLWEEERRLEGAAADADWQIKADAEADSNTVAALRAQQEEEKRKRERKAKEEWKRVEGDLRLRYKAEDEQKATDLRALQARERARELEDQGKEIEDLRLAGQRQREEAALCSLLSTSNRAQARPVIGAITASRQAQEMQSLMRSQRKAAMERMTQMVEAEFDDFAHARAVVEQLRASGEVSEEEVQDRLSALSANFSPALLSGRVFLATANNSSAAVARLQREQWEEQKELMRALYSDESFTSPEWADPTLDSLAAITGLQGQRMVSAQEVLQREMERLEMAEQEQLEAAARERQQRLAELERSLEEENAVVWDHFTAQLRTAEEEHKEKVREMEAELQQRLSLARSDLERHSLVAELQPLIEEEKVQYKALLSTATSHFEAELQLRNGGERLLMRRQVDEEMTATMREARKEKEAKCKAKLQEGEIKAEAIDQGVRDVLNALIDRGKSYRENRLKGMQAAVTRMLKVHSHAQTHRLVTPSTEPVLQGSSAATNSPPAVDALSSAQLAAIEGLLLRLQSPGGISSAFLDPKGTPSPPSSKLPVAVSVRELGSRAVVTWNAVQQLMAALESEVRGSPVGGSVTLSVTRTMGLSGIGDVSSIALPPPGLPLPHLCTLDRESRILWLWWDATVTPSSYLLSALYRMVSAVSGDDSTDSVAFHLHLHRCLASVLHHSFARNAGMDTVDQLGSWREEMETDTEEAGVEETVDSLTARVCDRLQRWSGYTEEEVGNGTQHKRREREETQRLMRCIDALHHT